MFIGEVMDLLIFLFIFAPITLIFHELGHVIAASFFHIHKIEINLGRGRVVHSLKWSNIRFILRFFFIGGASTQIELNSPSIISDRFISLGGPLFNLFIFLFFFPILDRSPHSIQLFIYFNAWMSIINLIPFRIGTKKSDGWRILETFR
ncbi:site-2 protease family protein [Bacillaceae bacterium S4-13-56]